MSSAIEIRHLRYFLAVAETENFTRAAERLAVSQPSVSQQIKDLERRLGVALFERFGQRVRLTVAGRAFRQRAEVVVRKLEEACDAARDAAHVVTGHVEFGVIPPLYPAWIPRVLERLARKHPGVTVAVHERASHLVETEIEAGHFDLGLGILSRRSPNLRYQRMLVQEVHAIVPAGHDLARRRALTLQALESVRLVLMPRAFDMRHVVDDMFSRARVRPRVAFEIATVDGLLQTAVHAGTPTLLPPVVLRGHESLPLRAVKLSGPARRMEFGLMWRRGAKFSPAAGAFRAFLVQGMAESVE